MLVSIRSLEVPELGASLRRQQLRHRHLTCKLVEARGVVMDDLLLAPTSIPTSVPGWPVVTVVLHGKGVVRADGYGSEAVPRELVWTPPGLDYRGRGGEGGTILVLLLQWDPAVFGGAGESADSARLRATDFDRLRGGVAEALAAGYDGARAAVALERICTALRALGLMDARPTAGDLFVPVDGAVERAGRAVDALLSNLHGMPGTLDLHQRLGRSAAHTRRLVTAYADALRAQGATSWRDMLHSWRLYMGASLMTAKRATTERVASALGYRSPAAFCHAFALAGMPSPGAIRSLARKLA